MSIYSSFLTVKIMAYMYLLKMGEPIQDLDISLNASSITFKKRY
jgi:hypothetical protein